MLRNTGRKTRHTMVLLDDNTMLRLSPLRGKSAESGLVISVFLFMAQKSL
jgi:hypothetical protein